MNTSLTDWLTRCYTRCSQHCGGCRSSRPCSLPSTLLIWDRRWCWAWSGHKARWGHHKSRTARHPSASAASRPPGWGQWCRSDSWICSTVPHNHWNGKHGNTGMLVNKNVCLVRFVSPIREENSGGINIMSSLSSRWRISMGMSAPFSAESALSFLFNLKCILY